MTTNTLLLAFSLSTACYGQGIAQPMDTLTAVRWHKSLPTTSAPHASYSIKPQQELTYAGVPLFVAGIIAKREKQAFRVNVKDHRHTLLTDFKTGVDDYTQFFGPAMTIGLKLGGVEGRSDWGRLAASSAMSYGIMAMLVNSLKYTSREMRPDGSTANSWPSGHTATAFVGATILHKEYGLTRSPWYSVAGYGMATATGVMRVMNNRHWVSDVLSGAGIGILSGELAYALSDLIFQKRGLLRHNLTAEHSIIEHPSFFAISMGAGIGKHRLDFDLKKFQLDGYGNGDKSLNLRFGTSTAVAAEGAYFFNKHIGIGGRLRVNTSPIRGWDGITNHAWNDLVGGLVADDGNITAQEQILLQKLIEQHGTIGQAGYSPALVEEATFHIKSDHLTEFAADLGVYLNFPISKRLALGTKLLAGRSIMQEIDLNATVSGGRRELIYNGDDLADVKPLPDTYTSNWDYFTIGGNNTTKVGTGLSLTYAYKENYAWKLFLDYDYTHKTYTMTYNPSQFLIDATNQPQLTDSEHFRETQSLKKKQHTLILGGSFTVSF